MIPLKSDCWFVTHDGDRLSQILVGSINELFIPVVINTSTKPKDTYTQTLCKSFIFVFESIEDVVFLFTADSPLMHDIDSLNVNNQILFFCKDCRVDQINSHIKKVIYDYLLNVIIIFVKNGNHTEETDILEYDLSIQTSYDIYAPTLSPSIPFEISSQNIGGFRHLLNMIFEDQKNHIKSLEIFRASLFDCPPHVILQNGSIDGVEYRIIKEILKSTKLKLEIITHEVSGDPWEKAKLDVSAGKSDLAMCSVWLTDSTFKRFEITSTLGSVCLTMLVPKPAPINSINYLFLSLDRNVWICFFASTIVTTFFLYYLNKYMSR